MEDQPIIPELLALGPRQENAFGDCYFYNLNPGTFKHVNANALFQDEFAKLLFEESHFYLIIGTDSGLLPKYIQNKGLPDGARYVFIEPETILNELNSLEILANLDERIVCTNETDWVEVINRFNIAEYCYIDAVNIYFALGVQEDTLGIYAELNWHITERIQLERMYHLTASDKKPFIVQQIQNLTETNYPAGLLTNAFKGKTAFILGGGPSLDNSLDWLVEHRHYVVIIAVTRIVVRLLQVGIEPDFIVSLDPYPVNFEVSRDIFSLSEKPVFIFGNHVFPGLIHQWPGRKLFLGNRVPWQSAINVSNIAPMGPTVSNTALAVACSFGFERIFLTGVDFCYTVDGISHAKGTAEHAAGPNFVPNGLTVQTYADFLAPVNPGFAFARELFEKQVKNLKRHTQLFNVSSSAARVDGIDYMPIDTIELSKEEIDIESIMRDCVHDVDYQSFLGELSDELDRAIYQFKAIRALARQAYDCNQRMYEHGLIKNYKDKLRKDKLQKLLEKKHRHYSYVVREFAIKSFLKMAKPTDDFDTITADEVQDTFRIYYASYIEGSNSLIDLVEMVKRRIKARQEELKEHPNWNLIIDQCQKDKCFGRVRIWRKKGIADDLSAQLKLTFDKFEHSFHQALIEEVANTTNVKAHSDLSLVETRATSLFRFKQVDMLNNLLLSVDKHPDHEQAALYHHLIAGYLAELEQKPEQALTMYQQVISQDNGPVNQALLRISHISIQLGAVDKAHQALERLSKLDIRYLFLYAKSSYIMGYIGEALNAFVVYWNAFPDDLVVQLTLAQIYLKQGEYVGAKMVLDHILLNHPNQEAAIKMNQQLEKIIIS